MPSICQRKDLCATADEQQLQTDQQGIDPLSHKARNGRIDFAAPLTYRITGIAGCCIHAASGHAAAALPSVTTNSRHRM
jgi:hypothetical protein